MAMDLRPIVDGETNWDIEGVEPADVAFLEQFELDQDSADESEAWRRVKDAEALLEECVAGQEKDFKYHMIEADERVQRRTDDEGEGVEDVWRCLDPERRRLTTALVFKRCGLPRELLGLVDWFLMPLSMPPAATEPSSDSYLCEIRVHFRPDLEEDGYGRDSPTVSGLVLRYSDGTVTKTGDLRGTNCPGPIILMMGEHIVGIKEITEGSKETVAGLSFYAWDENEFNRHFEVTAEQDTFCQEWKVYPPESSVVIAENDEVVHSLSWCPVNHCIIGHTTRPMPQCPNPRDTNEPEPGRVAGFSYYPYDTETGRERDNTWLEYENHKEYIWENHVPSDVIPEIENAVNSLSLKSDYFECCDAVFGRAVDVFDRSNEVHNICTLVKMISESREYTTKKKYRKELRRQYRALTCLAEHICCRMKDLTDVLRWSIRYEIRLEKDKEDIVSLEMSNKLARALAKHNVTKEKSLLVCAWCPGINLFDPCHVPSWRRCVHPGCASIDLPCCGSTEHVGFCDICHDPVCHLHGIYTKAHKKECLKALHRRCGYRGVDENGKALSLDTSCCGKVVEGDGNRCSGSDCGVLFCNDCSAAVCQGWDRQCTCMSWSHCEGENGGCKAGRKECPELAAFCKACAKSGTFMGRLKCEGCYDRQQADTISDNSDDSNYETEPSEMDEEFDADLDVNAEGWVVNGKQPRRIHLSFPDDPPTI